MYPICLRQVFKAAILEYNDYDNGIIRIITNSWLKVEIPSADRVFNVAFGSPGHWSRITQGDDVPFLDVTNEDYWLVDPSIVMTPAGGSTTTGSGSNGTGNGTGAGAGNGNGGTGTSNGDGGTTPPAIKTYKRVTVSGQVPMENYAQLFSSFVQTLKNNNLKIEIKFTAKTTGANPLTENSATIKSVKESASQLGLDFEVEE